MEPRAAATLVTGASSGLGRAITIRLSQERRLVLGGRDPGRLEETRSLCWDPGRHGIWVHDLREVAGIEASLAACRTALGIPVEAFVHCAGMVKVLPMRASGADLFQETFAVNVLAAAEIVRCLLRKGINRDALRDLVFVSSIWSRFGSRGHAAYCASKAGLDGLMRALAVELAPVVRVNSVLPGAVPTPMADPGLEDPEISARFRADYPLGLGRPEDVAQAVAYLLSAEARWVTGHAFTIDGGRTANMSLK